MNTKELKTKIVYVLIKQKTDGLFFSRIRRKESGL